MGIFKDLFTDLQNFVYDELEKEEPIEKKVFIINGSGGVGKDTFVNYVSKYANTEHITIAALPKMIVEFFGWDDKKTEKERKLLSDLKLAIDTYNDGNFARVELAYNAFMKNKLTEFLFIDMREPSDIKKAVDKFGAKTILVKRNSVKPISSNIADKGVFDIKYDFNIENNGSLQDLDKKAKEFVQKIRSSSTEPSYKKIFYISHPYEGKKENKEDVERITTMLAKKYPEYLFVSPISLFGFQYNDLTYEQGLKECLWLLSKCDGMILTGDYKNSKGCKAEIEYCKKHNIVFSGGNEWEK